MFGGEAFFKLLFAVTWLNVFVLLEPFLNKNGYKSLIFDRTTGFRTKLAFIATMNGAFFIWAVVLSVRI